MDFICNFPFFSIVLCLFAAIVCSILKARAARILTICTEIILVCLSAAVLIYTSGEGVSFRYDMGHFDAPWSNQLRAGVTEGISALVFSFVLLLSNVGGIRYTRVDITEKKQNLYGTLLNLIGAALMALSYTNDIFTGYVFLEILTLSSCGILVIRRAGRTTLAATRYMILNLLGSGLFLLGIVLAYGITGHLLMEYMQSAIAGLDAAGEYSAPLTVTIGLICSGLAIKAGLFPFHTWMPDTYGCATPSSSAVLSGIISKGYIFLLIKIMYRVVGLNTAALGAARHILFAFGICGIVFGSIAALHQRYLNRMIAYSSAAQIGYIFVGIGLGGTAGFTAAMFQIFAHSVTKPLLFLSGARLSEASCDSERFRDLQGSAHRNRLAGMAFTIGALSMVGIPTLAGFTAKLYFAASATEHKGAVEVITLAVLAVSTLLNALYFIRTIIRIYTPPEHRSMFSSASERIGVEEDGDISVIASTASDKIADMSFPPPDIPVLPRRDVGLIIASSGFAAAIILLGIFPHPISALISSGLAMFS